jgi:hypothetical protein
VALDCEGGGVRHAFRFLIAASVVAAVGTTSGCALACTQAGYTNVLEVVVTGPADSEVATMQLCTDEGCVEGARSETPGEWVFELFVQAPREPQVTAFDASGLELASRQLTVEWRGTTEPNGPGCENMATASPVTLEVP